jgi:hypothetical protein
MGYLKIDNLYKNQDILLFKECYAMEKIHGTSAHVSWKPDEDRMGFFSGGEKYDRFCALFDAEALAGQAREVLEYPTIFFGEAYGGKQQGMSKTYGDELKFVVFDVKVGEHWLSVPQAHELTTTFGLEFIDYVKIPTDLVAIDAERDRPSTQAQRNGIEEEKMREGIVLRPLIEVKTNNGKRVIAKHKRAEFRERKTIPEVDPAKREILETADAIADEWVTPMRMNHVLDKLGNPNDIVRTGDVIKAMVADVCEEADVFIVDSKAARKAIGKKAAKMYKDRIVKTFRENNK